MSASTSSSKYRRCSSVALSSNANTSPLRSSLGRRWSFDSTREGYVKDLKKYQANNSSSSSRDESYPLMLFEKTKKKKESSSASPRRVLYGRGHSMDVSSFAVPEDFELTQSSYSVYASCSRNFDESRSLRQRSSSLPRILPPIFDDEPERSLSQKQHRKSIAGTLLVNSTASTMGKASTTASIAPSSTLVREMQKFICRQASDVSHLLPLPLPTKYSLIIKEEDDETHSAESEFLPHEQVTFALLSLAKVHAASMAMKQIAPQLFADVVRTLDEPPKESTNHFHHHHSLSHHHSVASSSSVSSPSPLSKSASIQTSAQLRTEDIENRIANSISPPELRSSSLAFLSKGVPRGLCLNEDLNVKAINFRYATEESSEILSCKFDRMSATTVGPILGDLYSFLFNCVDPGALTSLDTTEYLRTYHSALVASVNLLKITIPDGLTDFNEFLGAFKRSFRPGLFIALLLATKRAGLHDKNEAKAKMEVFVEELINL